MKYDSAPRWTLYAGSQRLGCSWVVSCVLYQRISHQNGNLRRQKGHHIELDHHIDHIRMGQKKGLRVPPLSHGFLMVYGCFIHVNRRTGPAVPWVLNFDPYLYLFTTYPGYHTLRNLFGEAWLIAMSPHRAGFDGKTSSPWMRQGQELACGMDDHAAKKSLFPLKLTPRNHRLSHWISSSCWLNCALLLVVSNMAGLFSISYMGCRPSHWRTHIFQDG